MNTTEPLPALLEAYFADLDRALIGTDPRERAETVQAMREHAAEMLSRYGESEQTAERVIADFGPVEQIAAATTSAPATPAPAVPRSWVDIWLLVGSIVSLLFFVFPFVAIAMLVWAILRIRQHKGNKALQRAALWVSAVSAVFAVGLYGLHVISIL
ncbi:hypothetical protein [Arthrobacter sp. 08Y14]|uniref:HAAS signaling domain-containing protein n=1 Tax=Arthrobacter sp. 08Y14 TaxID=2058885 RepID=UPI000CE2D959|nr:hypothetical protein [Arthrobacter sp. 08Y14]